MNSETPCSLKYFSTSHRSSAERSERTSVISNTCCSSSTPIGFPLLRRFASSIVTLLTKNQPDSPGPDGLGHHRQAASPKGYLDRTHANFLERRKREVRRIQPACR